MRPISHIALEIIKDWGVEKIHPTARPYLDAMLTLDKITDNYFQDSAKGIVLYFLCNASQWKGEVARRVKKELKEMTK